MALNRGGTVSRRAKRPIFAIFEGGGAKGVAHVGALDAIERNKLDIIGVAGTSAGALVAVMVAIGLESADIMSHGDRDANILAQAGESPVNVLGDKQWTTFKRLLRRAKILLLAGAVAGVPGGFIASPRALLTARSIYKRRGHFEADRIKDFINRVIRGRLAMIAEQAALDWPIPDAPTFRDLARGWPTVIPLKIVVTDVDNGALVILDAFRTPDVVVAEAVAASVSIPMVFQPAAIPSFRAGRFADGGLVSNLPVWGFSEEKLGFERENADSPPVPIVGISLQAPKQDPDREEADGFASYLVRLAYAALQGSQGTAGNFLDDITIVSLEVPLAMLDFDKSWEAYRDAREAGLRSADIQLRHALEIKPDRIRRELVAVRDKMVDLLNGVRVPKGQPAVKQIRVNLIRPFGGRSLRVVESLNMEADTDDRLLLDLRGGGAALAYREKGLRVFRMGVKGAAAPEFMTKYEKALLRPSVRSLICVPIFGDLASWGLEERERPEPAGILAIDSDQPLASDFNRNDLKDMLAAQSAILYEAVNMEQANG